jgi:hypothetical protein
VQDTDIHGDPVVDGNGDPVMITIQVDLVKADGSIEEAYLANYVALWESAISGEDVPQTALDILNNDAKDANGDVKSSITHTWDDIRTVSGAGYEIKKTLTADVLNTDGKLAQIIAGSDVTIDTGVMNNQYANISAGGDITITSDTSITNNAYGASQTLHEVHKTGCFTCHEGELGYRETFGGIIEAHGNINLTANSLANTVTATRNTRFNLPYLDEFHDLRANANPVPDSFVVIRNVRANEVTEDERAALVDATAAPIDLSGIITDPSLPTPENITLNFGTFELPINIDKPYEQTIENRFPYTDYGEFLSSDYMVKRLQYSPEHENRMNSDEFTMNLTNRSSTTLFGNNINLNIRDAITLEGGVSATNDLTIDTEGTIDSSAQIKSGGVMSINTDGTFTQTGAGIQADNLNLYTGGDLNLVGTKVKANSGVTLASEGDINLAANRQVTSGMRGDTHYTNSRDIGTHIETNGDINLQSDQSITLTASTLNAQGGSSTLQAEDQITLRAGENYQEQSYSRSSTSKKWYGSKKTTTTTHHEQHLTHTESAIKGRDGVNLNAQGDITIKGSSLASRAGNIAIETEGDLTIQAVQDKHTVHHEEQTKKSWSIGGMIGINIPIHFTYGSSESSSTQTDIINQGSISDAMGDVTSRAGGTTTLQASTLRAGGGITIRSSQGIQILSATDTTQYKSQSSSSAWGSLIESEMQESLQKALTVSSLIDAQSVQIETEGGVVIEGSQIQADTVNFMAQYLSLISAKNSESYSSFSDSSGVVLRTIINQGYIQEEAVAAEVNANQITLNGKTLLEDKLNPQSILTKLSSEYDLNEEQIEQVRAELNNTQWHDKTTTLSKMGMIIVQVITTVLTAGAGTALIGAMQTSMSTMAQTMVAAAIDSMASQLVSQLATAALTGNGLELDMGQMLEGALKAAAFAGISAQINDSMGYNQVDTNGETILVDNQPVLRDLGYGELATQQILQGFAQKAIYGGSIEEILKQRAVSAASAEAFEYIGHTVYDNENSPYPWVKENIPKTVVHGLVGGTLGELSGGDFSSAAIGTAVGHVAAEYIVNQTKLEIENSEVSFNSPEELFQYLDDSKTQALALSSIVSGAVTLATHENISDEELAIAQSIGQSVVENNAIQALAAPPAVLDLLVAAGFISAATAATIKEEGLEGLKLSMRLQTTLLSYELAAIAQLYNMTVESLKDFLGISDEGVVGIPPFPVGEQESAGAVGGGIQGSTEELGLGEPETFPADTDAENAGAVSGGISGADIDTSLPGISGNIDGVISNDPYLMANKETIDDAIASVPSEYKQNEKCVEFSNALKAKLQAEGIEFEEVVLKSQYGIWSDKLGITISERGNGHHQAIKVGDIVYDNNNPTGISYHAWDVDLGITEQGIDIGNDGFQPMP